MKNLLTAGEAAALLHIHPQTLYQLASSGRLPSFKIGGVGLRFSEDELLAWIRDARRQVQVARPGTRRVAR